MAQKSSATSANDTLISNLEGQLNRLVEQLKDLEECKWVIPKIVYRCERSTLHSPFVFYPHDRCDLDEDEYQSMKDETVDQIKEFTETLDRMNKGDTTLTSTFSSMRQVSAANARVAITMTFNWLYPLLDKAIRKAIANSFNTVEMIRMFGDQSTTGLAQQLCTLEEEFQLKKLTPDQYENSKVNGCSESECKVHFVIEFFPRDRLGYCTVWRNMATAYRLQTNCSWRIRVTAKSWMNWSKWTMTLRRDLKIIEWKCNKRRLCNPIRNYPAMVFISPVFGTEKLPISSATSSRNQTIVILWLPRSLGPVRVPLFTIYLFCRDFSHSRAKLCTGARWILVPLFMSSAEQHASTETCLP